MKQCSKCSSESVVCFCFEGKEMRALCAACSHNHDYSLSTLPLLQACHLDKQCFHSLLQRTHDYHSLLSYFTSLEAQLHSIFLSRLQPQMCQPFQARHQALAAQLQDCVASLRDFTCWKQPLSPITHILIQPNEGVNFAIMQELALDPWIAFELVLGKSHYRPHEQRAAESVRWLAHQHWPMIAAKLVEAKEEAKNEYMRQVMGWADQYLQAELGRFQGKAAEVPYFLRNLPRRCDVPSTNSWRSGFDALLSDTLTRQCTSQEQLHEDQSVPALGQLLAVSCELGLDTRKELALRSLAHCRWKARPGLRVQDLALQAANVLDSVVDRAELAGVFRAVLARDKEEAVLVRSELGPAQLIRLRDLYTPLQFRGELH